MSYLSRIETERDELRLTVQHLLSGWNRMVDDIAALKKARDEYHDAIAPWKERAEQWASQHNEMEKGRDVWKGRAEELQRELDSTTHSVMDLKVSNADLFSRLQRESGNVEYLAAQNIALQQQVALLEMALAECASDKTLLEAKWQGVREVDKYHIEQDLEER